MREDDELKITWFCLFGELRYLRYALAAILAFTAFKLIAASWIHIPPLLSVGFIAAALAVAIASSLHARRRGTKREVVS